MSRYSYDQVVAESAAFRNRVTEQANANLDLRAGALTAGDSLPAFALVGRSGQTNLSALPAMGYEFVYLYRDDCQACAVLEPMWREKYGQLRGRVAFISYRPGTDEERSMQSPDHFGALSKTSERRSALTEFVPALLVVRDDGYITSIGDGISPVLRQLRLHKLAPSSLLDSIAGLIPGNR